MLIITVNDHFRLIKYFVLNSSLNTFILLALAFKIHYAVRNNFVQLNGNFWGENCFSNRELGRNL